MRVCVSVCACVRACVHACVCACVRTCVCVCVKKWKCHKATRKEYRKQSRENYYRLVVGKCESFNGGGEGGEGGGGTVRGVYTQIKIDNKKHYWKKMHIKIKGVIDIFEVSLLYIYINFEK